MEKICAKSTLALAPMEGSTDFACRFFLSMWPGISQMTSPFFRITSGMKAKSIPQIFAPEAYELKDVKPYEFYLQLMASRDEDIIRILNSNHLMPDAFEINCGCPSPTVVGNGGGSSILKDPDLFRKRFEFISNHFDMNQLSLKMRSGFEISSEFATLIRCVSDIPLKEIRIHARTRKQKYTGLADWKLIHNATEICKAKIAGSGDILDLKSFEERKKLSFNTSSFLIGRGALRNPWIFSEILNHRDSSEITCDAIPEILKLFLYLQELQLKNPVDLINLAGLWWGDHSQNVDMTFENKIKSLNIFVFKYLDNSFEFHTRLQSRTWHFFAMGRLKMFWNYLRSSMPENFQDRMIFRTKTPEEFFAFLNDIIQSHYSSSNAKINICYQKNWDPIYSGSKEGANEGST